VSLRPISVLKFGSSVLAGRRDLKHAVHEIYRELREARRVVAVVSALGRTTDRLLGEARHFGESEPAALALLLSTGESRAVALLALALQRAGISTSILDPEQLGLRTHGSLLDGEPFALDAALIRRELELSSVVVVPGFVGRDSSGATSLLGRGGSDLSALFLAHRLGASCRLLKDVDGVYERDPAPDRAAACALPRARRYATLAWDDALAVGGAVVQTKALRFAREHALEFEVGRVGAAAHTRIGSEATRFAPADGPPRRLRLALLGLGTVGLGVHRELQRFPERFEVASILVRDRFKRRASAFGELDPELATQDPAAVLDSGCEAIVELLGGVSTAADLVGRALERGLDVVTANKQLVVERGAALEAVASRSGSLLLHSATVGGAVPVLETVRHLAATRPIAGFEGIVNSTTNFVLEWLSEGDDLETAVGRARWRGYCEADPRLDLDGTDAAHKLELVARAAFGGGVAVRWLERRGIDGLCAGELQSAGASGETIRLVASCARATWGLEARLAPRRVPCSSLLGRTRGVENCFAIRTHDGETLVLRGKGAGRWPTTEAVLGDLLELSRLRQSSAAPVEEVAR
jgi:homoserine dehydrogenase